MTEKIIAIISEEMDIDPAKINENSNLYEDLGLDSMDLLSMMLTFEETFGVRFEKEETRTVKTVADIEATIRKKQEV